MKQFAITPETFSAEDVLEALPDLRNRGVTHIYLRSGPLQNELEQLIEAANRFGILPLVPFRRQEGCKNMRFGIHFKACETDALLGEADTPAAEITASCHTFQSAVKALSHPVSCVFVSPVFRPLSKPSDDRPLFPRSKLSNLVETYGERVAALGGMTSHRLAGLRRELPRDFSVAGVSLFFKGA